MSKPGKNDVFNPHLVAFLNFSRWFSAFLVVISHMRHLILVDYNSVNQKSIFCKALYFITGLGHEAVIVFFVISGYLVGGLTLERWRAKGPQIRLYVLARVSRIYTVLIPALVFGFAIDFVGLHWLNLSELYTNSEKYYTTSLGYKIDLALNFETLLGNLFMLQNIAVENLGSNSPLWSLANEWWYYCIFALFGIATTGNKRQRIPYALMAVAICMVLPGKIIAYGAIWLLGIAANIWINSHVKRPHPIVGIGIFLLAITCSRLSHNTDNLEHPESMTVTFGRDFLIGIAYVLALTGASRLTTNVPLARLHNWLSEFSYTTYLFHFPIMIFLVAASYQFFALQFQVQPDIYGMNYLFGATLITYICCYAASLATERQTSLIRNKLESLFSH